MIPVPTFRELAEKATGPDNWDGYMPFAICREDRAYLRRVSPATMLEVCRLLNLVGVWSHEPTTLERRILMMRETAKRALRLLDGVTDNAGKGT